MSDQTKRIEALEDALHELLLESMKGWGVSQSTINSAVRALIDDPEWAPLSDNTKLIEKKHQLEERRQRRRLYP